MRTLLVSISLHFVFGFSVSAQDDFWSSSGPLKSTSTTSIDYNSGAYGLYGFRDVNAIDVGQSSTSIQTQMTNWDKLMAQGEVELRKFVENEVKKYVKSEIKKAVGNELANSLGGQYGGVAGKLAGDILFGNEEKQAAEAERQAQLERERIAMEQKNLANSYSREFRSLLVDHNLSVVPTIPKTILFIVNIEEPNAISFSLFELPPNSYGELPYKIDLIKDYQQKTGRTQNYLYGPFKNVDAAKEEIKKIAFMAFLGFHEVKEDVQYTYGISKKSGPTNSPTTQDDNFWGTTKKSGN
jgi:hypothetical protein